MLSRGFASHCLLTNNTKSTIYGAMGFSNEQTRNSSQLVSEECTQQQSSREALNSQLLQLTNTIELQTTRDTKPFIFE